MTAPNGLLRGRTVKYARKKRTLIAVKVTRIDIAVKVTRIVIAVIGRFKSVDQQLSESRQAQWP